MSDASLPSDSSHSRVVQWIIGVGPTAMFSAVTIGVRADPELVVDLLRVLQLALQIAVGVCIARLIVRAYTELSEARQNGKLCHLRPSRELLVEFCASALAAGAVGVSLRDRWATAAGVLQAFAAPAWLVASVNSSVSGLQQNRERLARRFLEGTPFGRWLRGIEKGLNHPATTPVSRVWLLFQRRQNYAVSGVILLTSGALFLSGVAGIASGVASALIPDPALDEPHGDARTPPEATVPEATVEPPAAEVPDAESAGGTAPTFAEMCDATPVTLPGDGAPEWARATLWTLYFGPGVGAGAVVAGCPIPTRVAEGPADSVAYQLGLDRSGRVMSVALARPSRDGVLVLGRVAEFTAERLAEGAVLFASARIDAGAGDLQLIYEGQLTTAFVRVEKVSRGRAVTYCTLPPPASTAWIMAVAFHGSWLWPRCDSGGEIELIEPHDLVTAVGVISDKANGAVTLRIRGLVEVVTAAPVELDDVIAMGPPRAN